MRLLESSNTADRLPVDVLLKTFNEKYPPIEELDLKNMRLCVAQQWFGGKWAYTGVAVHTRDVEADILNRFPLGIHHLYMTDEPGKHPDEEPLNNGRIIHHPISQSSGPLAYFSIPTLRSVREEAQRVFHENDINLVHLRSPATPMGVTVAKVAKEMGIPLVVTYHGGSRSGSLIQKGKSLVELFTLPMSRRMAGASFGVSLDAIKTFGGDTIYMGNGIDTAFYNPDDVDTRKFYEQFPDTRDKKIIFTPGRIMKAKGQINVLKAFLQLPLKIQDESMIVFSGVAVMGGETYQQQLEKFIQENGLSKKVLFTGPLDKPMMKQGYATCSFPVVPSLEEPLGRVILEASSMKKPVICSDVGGTHEALNDGVTGYLVPPGDPKAIADRIEWLYNHPTDAQLIGDEGRRYILRYFSREKLAERHMRVYSSLLKQYGRDH